MRLSVRASVRPGFSPSCEKLGVGLTSLKKLPPPGAIEARGAGKANAEQSRRPPILAEGKLLAAEVLRKQLAAVLCSKALWHLHHCPLAVCGFREEAATQGNA